MNLSIKNVPEGLVEQLKLQAKRNHRSLQGEVLSILEETVQPRRLTVDEVQRRLSELNFKTESDAVRIIRQDRDGR